MLHFPDFLAWVDGWDVPHPDVLHDQLRTVLPTWSGTIFDACWANMLVLDPRELEEHRRKQIITLARYGRQPIGQWDQVPVTELQAWYRSLAELMSEEAEAMRVTEDR